MGRMSADIAALVVGVDEEVQPGEVFVIRIIYPQYVSEIPSPIQVWIRRDNITSFELPAVDKCGDSGQLSRQVEAVFQGGLPILFTSHTFLVALYKKRLALQGK